MENYPGDLAIAVAIENLASSADDDRPEEDLELMNSDTVTGGLSK